MSEINKICKACGHMSADNNTEPNSLICRSCRISQFGNIVRSNDIYYYNNFKPKSQQGKLTEKNARNWIHSKISIRGLGNAVTESIIESGIKLGYIEPKKKSALEEAKENYNNTWQSQEDSINIINSGSNYITELENKISELESKLNERG